MKTAILRLSALFALSLAPLCCAQAADFDQAKTQAETLFAEGSFSKARETYQGVETNGLSQANLRWLQFRLADTQWRAQASTNNRDNTPIDEARKQLNVLIRDIDRIEDRDRVWVEVQESLGDLQWIRRNGRNWGGAWVHYNNALEWWAGSADLETARARYISIVKRIAEPPEQQRWYYYGYYGNQLSLQILENYLKIANTATDRAHAHYLIAMTLRNQGDWSMRRRVPTEFELAIGGGRDTGWQDDALFHYAQWMENTGVVSFDENGSWKAERDYVKALSLYRSLVRGFKKGETRHFDQAQNRIRQITSPTLNVRVSNVFLPGSKIRYFANWRNLQKIDFELFAVDLSRDALLQTDGNNRPSWLDSVDLAKAKSVQKWTRDTKDDGTHKPGSASPWHDTDLDPGAYVLRAKSGNLESRDIVLVTDATLVLRTSGTDALVWFCDSANSKPIANANVQLSQRWRVNRKWHAKSESLTTDKDGIAMFKLAAPSGSVDLFLGAKAGARQAFSAGRAYARRDGAGDVWRIYAHTDRPAYRPKETVKWKFIVRVHEGGAYSTPANTEIRYEIRDARNSKVDDKTIKLNAFGSAWGELALTEKMPLGEYRIQFFTKRNNGSERNLGRATLFRLEEYKLPEFKVAVETPKENGRPKIFRLGDKVSVDIQADYYFGGPVSEAKVEVHVRQKSFWFRHRRQRDFPWFYDDMAHNPSPFGNRGQNVHHEVVKTDATGKATITFQSANNTGQDHEYEIEARVTDSSRREIVGHGSVKVTRQPYHVFARTEHNIHRPGKKVEATFTAQDANNQPIDVKGKVKVVRKVWREIWITPAGGEVADAELRALKKAAPFPPPVNSGQFPWRLKSQGYEDEEILSRELDTGADGEASLSFTPDKEGYYSVEWTSSSAIVPDPQGRPPFPITAQTAVWAADPNSTLLGYHNDNVQIIVDKDTFRVGETAPVMLHSPASDRYVLFCVEGEKLHSHQVIHLEGAAKLIPLAITEDHVPNIFLNASTVTENRLSSDQKQVIVPPTKNFLTVEVEADRKEYQPREEGELTLTARDHEGKPVAAEISFGLVDESVFYIQQDYAGDPRKHYFGAKRGHRIRSRSSFNDKSYIRYLLHEKYGHVDERQLPWLLLQEASGGQGGGGGGGGIGGGGGGGLRGLDRSSGQMAINGAAFDFDSGAMVAADAMAPESAAAPMAAAAEGMVMDEALSISGRQVGRGGAMLALKRKAEKAPGEPAVIVRSDFRSTIFWQPDVRTDKNGKARVRVKYPDSLTGWKATARVVTKGNQFGIANTETRTKNPLIVRLQAPRFFVAGDTVIVSAVINNNTSSNLTVGATLETAGLKIEGFVPEEPGKNTIKLKGFAVTPYPMSLPKVGVGGVKVAPGAEKRVDWLVTVEKPGEVKLRVIARQNGGALADAMEKTYTAHEHGIEKFVNKSGKVRGKDVTINLNIPKERQADSTALTVQIAPSMAVTMLDALPYLIHYPYGCVEQTMSRFLPAAITAKTLRDLGLKPEDVMGRVFGGIELAHVAKTQPKGRRDLAELDAITKQSLERLYDFQHGDGGWGWWKHGNSDHFMTSYVIWGLALAKQAGIEVKDSSLNRAINWLDKELVEQENNFDNQAWMLHALASTKTGGSNAQNVAFANLWKNRTRLNAYSRSLLALSAHYFEDAEKAKVLIRNLENGVKRDDRPDQSVLIADDPLSTLNPQRSTIATAHWGEDGVFHRWSDGGVEATAFALRALLAIDPENKLVEPVTNWLIKNRRGAQWSNTRDTAIAVLTMNDYLRASGELEADIEYTLTVNGKRIVQRSLSGADVFNAPSRFAIDRKHLRDGVNKIRIKRKQGDTPLYFAAECEYFSLEEPIPAAGNEIFVRRDYTKLVETPTLLKGLAYKKVPLKDGDTVQSGERVEVVLTIEAKNNYEYLVFEDLKPAGLEAVQIRSGESMFLEELNSGEMKRRFSGNGRVKEVATAADSLQPPPIPGRRPVRGARRWVHQELRDRKVALFVDKLPEGVWELRYTFRAEVPGAFHALPVLGHAMYVPEIRCNGDEIRVTVLDGTE